MRYIRIAAISLVLALLIPTFLYAHAFVQPQPSSYYGTVHIDDTRAASGTVITAWIDHTRYAQTVATLNVDQAIYNLDVPADDPATPLKEGGVPNDIVQFRIGSTLARETGIWFSDTNTNVNLSASPSAIHLVEFRARSESAFTIPLFAIVILILALLIALQLRMLHAANKSKP